MRENGTVHQIFKSSLKVTVEIGMTQNAVFLIFCPVDIHMALQCDVVLRQRSGLVGAKNVHRAEILDSVQVLDNRLLPRH